MRFNSALAPALVTSWLLGLLVQVDPSNAMESWKILSGRELAKEAAIIAAAKDLQSVGESLGVEFQLITETPTSLNQTIVVGNAERNPVTAELARAGKIRPDEVHHPQGFRIQTVPTDEGRFLVVSGGSVLGDVYGLYWIWDRIQVHKRIPDLDLTRTPALPIRLAGGDSPAAIRNALRHTATWVTAGNILDLVPWEVEPEATENRENRQEFQRDIDNAHAYRMKYLAGGDEMSFHPAFLERSNAKLDPNDPALWQALQEKYRLLFRAMPDLDGVVIRTGEHTRVFGNYRPYDVMHEPRESDWPLEKRYRTFVQKMHEVVVGEFDKIYFHRTWVTNATEQHSDPEVYKAVFTDDVPKKSLYLSPYLSLADRWYYQPYNPTFNLTPHNMVVLLASLDYHTGGGPNDFPSFPGEYHQGGIQSILSAQESNLVGIQSGFPVRDGWDSHTLTGYVAFRLAWNPNEDLRQIAQDFASIHVGPKAAPAMADILLLSQRAYKDGIYVKPVAESVRGNTLPHLRTGVFQRRGIPELDRGRAHISWLRSSMDDPCKGRHKEAVEYLDRGLEAAVEMQQRYAECKAEVEDSSLAQRIGDSLDLTRLLVETNGLYVKTCFAYLDYVDKKDAASRTKLSETLDSLKQVRHSFAEHPDCRYKFYGIDQLIASAGEALEDLARSQKSLTDAPAEEEVSGLIRDRQERNRQLLEDRAAEAHRFFHWRAKVDGRDILSIQGEELTVEHIESDSISSQEHEFLEALPKREVTVLLKDNESQPIHPFILQQPAEENGYTLKVYLFDRPPGFGWWDFDLYYADETATAGKG